MSLVLMDKYDAMVMLCSMIDHTSDIVRAFYRYLSEGRIFPVVSGFD